MFDIGHSGALYFKKAGDVYLICSRFIHENPNFSNVYNA